MSIKISRGTTSRNIEVRHATVLRPMNPSQLDTNAESKPLRIMQYNVAKRREVMDSILNDESTEEYALLLLQEHCYAHKQNTPQLHQSWTAIESTMVDERPSRTSIYINNNKITPATFEQIFIPYKDITAISIMPSPPFIKPILIINIYNADNNTLIDEMDNIMHQHVNIQDYEVVVLAGDFNLHHPLWNPIGYTKHDVEFIHRHNEVHQDLKPSNSNFTDNLLIDAISSSIF